MPVGIPTELQVLSVGLTLEVRELPWQEVIDPPREMKYAYWDPHIDIEGLVVIAAHSWDDGYAPFNALLDIEQQQPAVAPGQEVIVTSSSGTQRFVIEWIQRFPKGGLATAERVWGRGPQHGRLVLITCFQRNDGGSSQDNLVVSARQVHNN